MADPAPARAALLLCAYRGVAVQTMEAIVALTARPQSTWRLHIKAGDALIGRARATLVTHWRAQTDDDVCLMVDDDIVFTPEDADRLVALCRDGHDIICGAYPVRDGTHLACRFLTQGDVRFGTGRPPIEIGYAATGFMAVHRRAIDALAATLPLCHANTEWAFYPMFAPMIAPNEAAGGWEWLSEDYGFCKLARDAGFRVWLDPQTLLRHLATAPVSIANMAAFSAAAAHA